MSSGAVHFNHTVIVNHLFVKYLLGQKDVEPKNSNIQYPTPIVNNMFCMVSVFIIDLGIDL